MQWSSRKYHKILNKLNVLGNTEKKCVMHSALYTLTYRSDNDTEINKCHIEYMRYFIFPLTKKKKIKNVIKLKGKKRRKN